MDSVADPLPFYKHLSGWCMTGNHLDCSVVFRPVRRPDPARKGATYTPGGWLCPCPCHKRLLDWAKTPKKG